MGRKVWAQVFVAPSAQAPRVQFLIGRSPQNSTASTPPDVEKSARDFALVRISLAWALIWALRSFSS